MKTNEKERKILDLIQKITDKKIDIKKKISYDLVEHFRIFKIKRILLITSSYDYFKIEEEGRLKNIFKKYYLEFSELNIPKIIHVETEDEAINNLRNESFDLILILDDGKNNINSLIENLSNISISPIALIVNKY